MSFTYAYINLNGAAGSASDLMHQLVVASNLNASGLAKVMGVAPSTVTRILHGQVCPSYDDMVQYAHRLAFQIEDNQIVRPKHLRGYRSPKEIGDFINSELAQGLDSARLRFILRYIPKTVIDWQDLSLSDTEALIQQPAAVSDKRFQALVEGITQFYSHCWLWEKAPTWTEKTKLDEIFVPRATVREIGDLRYRGIQKKCAPEFVDKNVFFTHSEMMVI